MSMSLCLTPAEISDSFIASLAAQIPKETPHSKLLLRSLTYVATDVPLFKLDTISRVSCKNSYQGCSPACTWHLTFVACPQTGNPLI